MSEEIVYIDYDEALTIYGKMIDASDGGFEGVRDEGGIRATLDFVQNDLYYPTFAEKLTYLMYRFCSGHFFNDGNKRIALTLGAYFLHKNNYYWHACICMRTLESIIYHVAASNINQDLLLRIVNSFLTSKDYDRTENRYCQCHEQRRVRNTRGGLRKRLNMKTIKIILLLFCIILGINAKAQTVGYTYKALAAEGCNMKYSVAKQDTIYSIVATVRSDRMKFLTKPTMKIRTFTGKYLELRGTVIGNGSQSAGVISGNIVIPITEISSTAQFRITPQQFEILNEGVAKIRLSMTPMNHERTFKKDKIGKKLYQFYLNEKQKDENF